jgi:glycosyltransferase involved in cell wall biosynthesis
MSKRRKNKQPANAAGRAAEQAVRSQRRYEDACRRAEQGRYAEARRIYQDLDDPRVEGRLRALVRNDLAALAAVRGDAPVARRELEAALALDPACQPARANLALLQEEAAANAVPPAALAEPAVPAGPVAPVGAIKVAVLSFLFNWPSTGGGIVHTVELAQFLGRAGYDVRHFYAHYPPWGIGDVSQPVPYASEALDFDDAAWNAPAIQERFRRAVDAFAPDYVLVTDSWNMKPLLAEAVRGYPTILRFQAMECLCPLNNVRLLPEPGGQCRQCALDQLSAPQGCAACLRERGAYSGGLHQAERALSGAGTLAYHERLLQAFREAEAVLVVNPLTEALVRPYVRDVRVVTAGMDPARFPWPWDPEPARVPPDAPKTVFFAGLVDEWMKGFHVLRAACRLLWQRRQDFELVATGDPPGCVEAGTRFVGWLSQADLPRHLRAADLVVLPTVAQEALGRTAVEAMAVGRPVVASRLGGLPATVRDGETGLLCEPGDPEDLARKIETLLDDAALRERLGLAGRKRFEEHYAWPVIIDRHYRPLLSRRRGDPAGHRARTVPPVPSGERTPDEATLSAPHRPAYAPFIPAVVDEERLVEKASRFFGLPRAEVAARLRRYRALHDARGYAQVLGERKTLCFEEAFVLALVLGTLRPPTIVEIGTQHGKSTRRLLDLEALLGLHSRVVCFDVANQVEHFTLDEAELVLGDVTGRVARAVLEAYEPGLLFLDVHAYALLQEVVTQTLAHTGNWVLALHDCGRGLCNPHMTLARDDPRVTSSTGVWERHVLAEAFGVTDPLSAQLDWLETASHRLCIFDTPHGLGVILPKCVCAAPEGSQLVAA